MSLGQLDLLLRREQRDLADLPQIHAHRVVDGVVDGDIEQFQELLLFGEVLEFLLLDLSYLHPHLAQQRVDELEFFGRQVGVLHERAHLVQSDRDPGPGPGRGCPAIPRR